MPYDFTCLWNLENEISKEIRNRLIDTENRLMARGEWGWRTAWKR